MGVERLSYEACHRYLDDVHESLAMRCIVYFVIKSVHFLFVAG